MELKKLSIIIVSLVLAILLFLVGFLFIFNSSHKKDSFTYYKQGIEYFEKNDFQDAYYNFTKIYPNSPLFLNALYKQAKSAENAGDYKTAIKKYSIMNKLIKNKNISPYILWRLAVINHENKNERNAKKYFLNLRDEYKTTEYGIASNFYLSKLTKNKEEKKEYLLDYIKYSPKGRFIKEALAEILGDSEIKLNDYEKLIVADALNQNENYKLSINLLKNVPINLSWVSLINSLDKLNSGKNVLKVANKGFSFENSNFDEETLLKTIKIYLKYIPSPLNGLNEIYKTTNDERIKGLSLYLSANYVSEEEAIRRKIQFYEKYPSSKFASTVLYELFMESFKNNKKILALKYGKKHMAFYKNKNESPAVYYYVATLKKKNLDNSYKETTNKLMAEYPRSYYAYKAYSTLIDKNFSNKRNLKISKNVFIPYPYKEDKKERQFFENFAKTGDFKSFEDFRIQDPLILSWVEYKKGNRALSSVLARDYINGLETSPKQGNVAYKLAYPIYYNEEINKETKKKNLNPYLILALIKEESHFDPNIRSNVGATGLMQIMPTTAEMISGKTYTIEQLQDEDLNISLGTSYFKYLMNEFLDNEPLCVLSYNSGPNAVKRWLDEHKQNSMDILAESIPYFETKNYIKKVYTAYWNYLLTYEKVKI